MRPIYAPLAGSGLNSEAVILDQYISPTDVLAQLELYGGTGGSYALQYSPDDPYATYATDYNTNANWYTISGQGTIAADTMYNLTFPARAIRVATTTAATSPTSPPRLVVIQAGVR